MEKIECSIQKFNKVSLADLDKVKLMNRNDSKYCMHIDQLPVVLNAIQNDYSILEIDNKTIFSYDTTYFDTVDNQMYLAHQNGKGNRYKIRIRKYVDSDLNFLEIKFKTNKGRTIKERIVKPEFKPVFEPQELDFLEKTSPYSGVQLQPKINNHFQRITLVNHEFTERVTIDLASSFTNERNELRLNKLVIIEIKQSRSTEPTKISKALQELRIKSHGFSKYSFGRSLLEEQLKKNNFKPRLLKIQKEYMN